MDHVRIEATERTPEVYFDFNGHYFSLRGEAYPEDTNAFFGPLMNQLEDYFQTLDEATITFEFELIYFNSSTAKVLMMLFELLDATAARNNAVKVHWIYEADDDNMEVLGEEYGEDLEHVDFSLVPKEA
ncbi:DUF1987 domain-containing protein [Rhabdochromatium marinum]|uniref:DUF1987 domain-containing protein n=1 Tax=Rhabdochromatium marinum TaxID=48729 RepID=UPI0019083395|nr:DUF1987 domain-containing protein [Rhabdochromatium marinum]MBK1648757.1 Fe-S oxidoreductase [Rhabdochromatium marinum]